ncbi:MAG: replication factor C large subunit [Candidatus Bathyarchaeia archaeon]|jgi:replication factor C large subunit
MNAPWTAKHRPKMLADIAGNKPTIQQILDWLELWKKGPPKKRALLLHGPPGTGKTVSVEAAANERGLDLVEINASDKRNRDALERTVGLATRQSDLFGRSRLVLIDEVDGINLSEDRGAVDTIVRFVEDTQVPVILTANDPWDPKIGPIRNATTMIEYRRLGLRDAVPYLKKICQKEGVEVDEQALRLIVDRNQGDMRSIMNDLQVLTSGRKKLTYEETTWLGFRDRRASIFDALKTVFTSPTCLQARRATDLANVDLDMFFEWVYENAPRQLNDPRDLSHAMSALAQADLYHTRIDRTRAWELLPYALEMETAGVAMSKEFTKPAWVPMKFPERIQLLSRTRKKRSIEAELGRSIGSRCHISSRRAIPRYLPYIKYILEKNPTEGARLVEWLHLSEDAMEYLGVTPTPAEPPTITEEVAKKRAKPRTTTKPRRKKKIT